MKRFYLSISFLFISFFLLTPSVFAAADWTLYVHMAADNNLSAYASMDLVNEMAKATLSPRVNVVVECDMPQDEGTYRIKIENNEAVIVDVLSYEMGQNQEQELVTGMKWATSNYPAEHYAISLWGHGSGIIDPIRKLTRGILFDDTNNTYLNNQDMLTALSRIKSEVLGGKNIDVLGMDACLMADLEVGYQIKDYVNYFVASQQTEPAFGWDYSGFLTQASSDYCSPAQFATAIVDSYKTFYDKKKTADYTQSAVDLTKIGLIEQNLDFVISKWNECEDVLGFGFKGIINQIRGQSLEFEDDNFIDLHYFYKNILEEINQIEIPEPIVEPDPEQTPEPEAEPEVTPPQTTPRPRPHFARPNYFVRPNSGHQRPGSFVRPSGVNVRPSLNSRPSNVACPPRPRPNINPRPSSSQLPRPSIRPRPQQSNNTRPSYQRPNYQRPGYSRPQYIRPQRSFDFIKSIDFEKLNLSNNELESLNLYMQELKELLTDGMDLIESSVVANETGPDMSNAKGISIYFPKDEIHSSYYLTNFANDGNWVSFLDKFVS